MGYRNLRAGSGNYHFGSYVSISGTVAASVSGNVVVTSVSGNVVITSVSGNVVNISGQIVQISGQSVFVYVSGGSFSADVSGNVVWGYGTSGQMPGVYRFRFVGDNFRDVSSFPVRVNYNCVCIRAADFCRGISSAHGVAEWNRNVIHVHYDQRVTVLGSRGILGDIELRHFRRLYLLTMLLLWGRV